jgi:hypothetical protein
VVEEVDGLVDTVVPVTLTSEVAAKEVELNPTCLADCDPVSIRP